MNTLLELQTAFQAHLLDNTQRHIFQSIVSTNKMPAEKRVFIYSYGYYARLIEALAANYPNLYLYLGTDAFNKVGQEYAQMYPSGYRSIRWFGDKFALFLKDHHHYKKYPYLSELATIEWTMSAVFDAPDANVLALSELAAIPPDAWLEMQLVPHPSLHRLNLSWNTIAMWQALNQDQPLDKPVQYDVATPWMFWRTDLVNHFSSLQTADAWAIDAMIQGLNFGEICEGLTQWQAEENVAVYAAGLLKGWINEGLICAVQV